MKIINSLIPFKGFIAMAVFPFIFIRKENKDKFTDVSENHEKIHFQQQKEMLLVFFYIWYIIEWMFKGYKNISFEKEAYSNQDNNEYLKTRKPYRWFKYIK